MLVSPSFLLSGSVAKEFFEKSKLPVQELSKIWCVYFHLGDGVKKLHETIVIVVVLNKLFVRRSV